MPAPRALGAALAAAVALALLAVPTAASAAPAPVSTYSTAPDPLSRYSGQVSCDPVVKPGAAALSELVKGTYGPQTIGISRSCAQGAGSEHKEGRALDWMLAADDPQERAVADDFLLWLLGPDADGVWAGNARRLGVMYVIYDRQMWEAYRASDAAWSGWKAYSGPSPHTDHIHMSLSWDGAWKRTSFWAGKAIARHDYGPCQVYIGEPAPTYTEPNYSPCPKPVYRPADWYVRGGTASAGSPSAVFGYGISGDTALACDFDGDGVDGVVTYRNGTWKARRSASPGSPETTFSYGASGQRPVCGDWDGDGKDGIGTYQAGTWRLRNSASGGTPHATFAYGWNGPQPVVGDWDGNGTDTVGLYSGGSWLLRDANTAGSPDRQFTYGWAGPHAVSGDWDGDGRDGVGVVAAGRWYLRERPSPGDPDRLFEYGWSGPAPVPGRWTRGVDGVAVVNNAV